MASEITIEDKKVKTKMFRVSYPNCHKAKAMEEDGEPKYSITMLFDKDTNLKAMKKAVEMATKEKWGDKIPKKLRSPFRDGDEEKPDDENYENKIFISASSKKKPQVVDGDLEPVTEEDFYAGCYARATLIAFGYEVKGNKGVAFALQNVQKLEEGEALSKKRSAEEDFADDDYKDSKKKKSKSKKKDDDDDDDDGPGF